MAGAYAFRPHMTAPAEKRKIGKGHWLIYVKSESADILKYSCDDNDFWYGITGEDGKIYLYDVKLYVDDNSSGNCVIVQLPLESFIGVSGGRTQVKPSTYNNKWDDDSYR